MLQSRDRFQKFLLTAAGNSGNAENLPRPRDKGDILQNPQPLSVADREPADIDSSVGFLYFGSVNIQRDMLADHHFRQLLFVCIFRLYRIDISALAQNSHTVRDLHNLIELMRDDNNRLAGCSHIAENVKEPLCLLRR